MNWKLVIIAGLILPSSALYADKPTDKAQPFHRTDVVAADDWPADSMIDMGAIYCPGGELEWFDPVTPVCPGSGRIHMRKIVGYGCYEASDNGSPEPRFSGVGMFEVNGNLRADYSGRVWGTWMVVPSEDCDPQDLVDPPVYWKGVWQGPRSMFCNGGGCFWIGSLKLVGKGHGGELQGLHFKGREIITTYTPMPIPWELIGVCDPDPSVPCGPEGVITGVIKEQTGLSDNQLDALGPQVQTAKCSKTLSCLLTDGWYTEESTDVWPMLHAFETVFEWVGLYAGSYQSPLPLQQLSLGAVPSGPPPSTMPLLSADDPRVKVWAAVLCLPVPGRWATGPDLRHRLH